jgi:hypothetical protein
VSRQWYWSLNKISEPIHQFVQWKKSRWFETIDTVASGSAAAGFSL